MTGIRIKLGPFELEISESAQDNITFTICCSMLAAAVLAGLVLLH